MTTAPPGHGNFAGRHPGLSFALQIAVGASAWVLVKAVVGRGLLGDTLGFLAMCAAMYPFARRDWAARLPAWRYWAAAAIGAAVAAALRMLLQ